MRWTRPYRGESQCFRPSFAAGTTYITVETLHEHIALNTSRAMIVQHNYTQMPIVLCLGRQGRCCVRTLCGNAEGITYHSAPTIPAERNMLPGKSSCLFYPA